MKGGGQNFDFAHKGIAEVTIEPAVGKAGDNFEQVLSDHLLGTEHRVGFEPVIPARDSHVGVGGENAMRGELVGPDQESGIQLLIVALVSGGHGLDGNVAFFPLFQLAEQTGERGNPENDDEIAADITVLETKASVDHESVLEFLLVNGDGAEDTADRVEVQAGDGESDLDLKKIAKDAEASVEDDIADLDEGLPSGGI